MSWFRKFIVKSNDWYDELPDVKRIFAFLVILFLPLTLITIFLEGNAFTYSYLGTVTLIAFWRFSRVFYHIKEKAEENDGYKKN